MKRSPTRRGAFLKEKNAMTTRPILCSALRISTSKLYVSYFTPFPLKTAYVLQDWWLAYWWDCGSLFTVNFQKSELSMNKNHCHLWASCPFYSAVVYDHGNHRFVLNLLALWLLWWQGWRAGQTQRYSVGPKRTPWRAWSPLLPGPIRKWDQLNN